MIEPTGMIRLNDYVLRNLGFVRNKNKYTFGKLELLKTKHGYQSTYNKQQRIIHHVSGIINLLVF